MTRGHVHFLESGSKTCSSVFLIPLLKRETFRIPIRFVQIVDRGIVEMFIVLRFVSFSAHEQEGQILISIGLSIDFFLAVST